MKSSIGLISVSVVLHEPTSQLRERVVRKTLGEQVGHVVFRSDIVDDHFLLLVDVAVRTTQWMTQSVLALRAPACEEEPRPPSHPIRGKRKEEARG